MVGKVKVGGKDVHAIIIDCHEDSVPMYRNSLIETLKVAAINEQCDLKGGDVYNVLDIIQATLPEEEGGTI